MKYYAVLDTNVLVSAMLKWNSIPGKIMELAFSDKVVPVFNHEILNEYREVLSRPKFHLTDQIVSDFIEAIEEKGIHVQGKRLQVEMPDPKDIVFYEVVMDSRTNSDTYLVTGNMKHFPIETFIITPREFLDLVGQGA